MARTDTGLTPLRVLLVCSGNLCRSPIAEALLRRRLDATGRSAEVHSAGFAAAGRPAPPGVARALQERGVNVTDHRSRRVEAAFVREAALVIGMERLHVREVVLLVPDAWPRAFTMKELVRRGEAIGRRRPEEAWTAWLARAHAGRDREDLLGWSIDDDVEDPIGGDADDFQRAVTEIDDLVTRLAGLLWSASDRP